jgi:hypothetical protein
VGRAGKEVGVRRRKRKDWNREMGKKREMDGWVGLDSLARSLRRSVVEEAGNESFPLFFIHFFSLLVFKSCLQFLSLSLRFHFHVSYYKTAFPPWV